VDLFLAWTVPILAMSTPPPTEFKITTRHQHNQVISITTFREFTARIGGEVAGAHSSSVKTRKLL
jgi:hypothetical protein